MADADARIAELERQVALLNAQLSAVRELPSSNVEARLRALLGDRMVLDAFPGIVNVLDRDHRVVYLNRTVPGRNLAELYGTDAQMYVAEEYRERYRRIFQKALDEGKPTELRLRTLSGRYWDSVFVPVKDAGEVVFMLVTSTDVTARVASEEALRESEARLRLALTASGMGIWTYRVTEDVLEWDAVTARLFGLSLADAPKTLGELIERVHPEDRARFSASSALAIREGKYVEIEYRVLLADSRVRHLMSKGAVTLDAAGRTVLVRGGVFDVTAQRELESQLQLGHKMQAVGQLTSGIAHNLNNALSVIIPSAELCLETVKGELASRISDIEHAARRAAEMVQQLMLFARPQAVSEKRPFDVVESARRIVGMCRETFDRRISIEFEAQGAPLVRGDAGQIEQVLLNLCLNARDALLAAERTHRCISMSIGPDAGRVRVTVRDNGAGMDEHVRARIFEPFFTTKDVGRGTGLGLATAYAIVTDHGGSIRCHSQPGRGTTFEIELPAAVAEAFEQSPAPRHAPAAVGSESILIVDDEAGVRQVLASVLERAGYAVKSCASGEEALRLLGSSARTFDLVLLDRSMPGMPGDQVVLRLRSLGIGIPVILVTGDPGEIPVGAEVSLVLGKPVRRQVLLGHVRAVLDRVRAAPSRDPRE